MVSSLRFCPTRVRVRWLLGGWTEGVHGIDEDLLMTTAHGLRAALVDRFIS